MADVDKQITAAIGTLPPVLREEAEIWFERQAAQHDLAELPAAELERLCRVVACSEFAGAVLRREWPWFAANVASLEGGDTAVVVEPIADDATRDMIQAAFRRTRNRAMLRIAWRELCGFASLDETLRDLSSLADTLLQAASEQAERLLEPRYGHPVDSSGERVPLVILAMGKLGGRELNFSSDIDLIFLFAAEGTTNGARQVSAQEYFGRLSRQIIALLDEVTSDGFAFRIDTRLRPFGESGPPVISFAALEAYLLQHGRDWERYAYVKARVVGREPDRDVLDDLEQNLIRPFVYRRYIDYGVFESLRKMHDMIAAEVQRRELRDNIKLGPGGIREAEFIVQSLQLVRGGSAPALQGCEFQEVLPKLVHSRGLTAEGAEQLRDSYRFLRRLENFIQIIRDQQTHELPAGELDRARLCLAMGYPQWSALLTDLDRHRATVARQFDRIAFRAPEADLPLRGQLASAWEHGFDTERWVEILTAENCRDAEEVAMHLVRFAEAPATRQIDAIARERLLRFVPALLAEVVQLERPAVAMQRALSVVASILRRSAYISLLNENPAALTRLVNLCARSRYIAAQLVRHPVLLDELLDPHIFSGEVTKQQLATEIGQRLAVDSAADSEARIQIISQFQRVVLFRIAVADFNGALPIMKVSDGLTWLAEVVLAEMLEVAWQDIVARHGKPTCRVDNVTCDAGFGIIAYGKLGGLELSYGSDLDIVFLHNSRGRQQVTDGEKPLDNSMFYGRLVRRLVHFLTTQTGSGALYEVDTRLRPDGHKGLLVTSTDAFERYQEDNAWTWEHQALLRARPVAGSAEIAREFARIRSETLMHRVKRETLREDVVSMRQRMRQELDRSNADQFDLKHGAGGIGDIEFLVQYLVLLQAGKHPAVIEYSDNIRQLDALAAAGCLEPAIAERLKDCYRSYRLRQHHLVLDERKPLLGADEFVDERNFVTLAWEQWLD